MQIILRRNFFKRVVILLEAAVFLGVTTWVLTICLADIFGKRTTIRELQLAVKFDPGSSEYQLRLGRLFEYSPEHADPTRAVQHFRRAVELSQFNPQPWLEMAAALEFQGETTAAEACLRRADFLGPQIPSIQWTIGNLFLLHAKVDEAFRHFKVVLSGSSQYDRILFDLAWKASGDARKILDQLIPDDVRTEFNYLDYLLSHRRYPEAQNVWKRIANSPETFSPGQASNYIDTLIGAHRPAEAFRVWNDLRDKGLIRPLNPGARENLLENGNLEEDILNFGFDWRNRPPEDVYARLDQTTFHSPGHAFLIQFLGKQNIQYQDFFQFVKVQPGKSYRLQGFMKTEGITTDSGPRLQARDYYDPGKLNKISEDRKGSTTGWLPVSLDFEAGPKTELIVVAVIRLSSQKIDNLIQGKVWLDDFSLVALPSKAGRAEN